MTDWYGTENARKSDSPRDPWWVGSSRKCSVINPSGPNAPVAIGRRPKIGRLIPRQPTVDEVVPAADHSPTTWRYTETGTRRTIGLSRTLLMPPGRLARSGFVTQKTPAQIIGTVYGTRRIFGCAGGRNSQGKLQNLELWVHHDDDVQVYVNASWREERSWTTTYDAVPLSELAKAGP